MNSKKRKLDSVSDFNPNSVPIICYELIFQYLPIESLVSAALTCKTWYNILSDNRRCFNRQTKLTLSNEVQLSHISNSKILRHINRIELGEYRNGLSINTLSTFEYHFTSLRVLKLCFNSLTTPFITHLFECIAPTLQRLILAIQSNTQSTASCLLILSSLHLLSNLIDISILLTSSLKIEFSIEKYFKPLTKLERLVIRQDNYTWKRSRIEQLNALALLPNLRYLEWFDTIPNDLKILSSISSQIQLRSIHIENMLITNEVLYYLSHIPTIDSIKSHRFSPIKSKLNIDGFNYLLALKDTLKELEISTKNIVYNELTIIQYPAESDCTEDEYQVELNDEHIKIFKQFIHLKSLSLIQVNINSTDLENLLIHLDQFGNLKILDLESICFPSLTILSTIHSLEELSLSYNINQREYSDEDLLLLSPLNNLKILTLYYSMNLSKKLVKQLKQTTSSATNKKSSLFPRLQEFIYNNDDDEYEQ